MVGELAFFGKNAKILSEIALVSSPATRERRGIAFPRRSMGTRVLNLILVFTA
jgi:hypothetical protein